MSLASDDEKQPLSHEDAQERATLTIIQSIWPSEQTQVKVKYAAGGILVEIIDPSLREERNRREGQAKFAKKIHEHNLQQSNSNNRIVIPRLLMYASYQEIFSTHIVLRTKQSEYSSDGLLVVTSSAGDTPGWMAQLDADALLYDVECPFKVRLLLESKNRPSFIQAQRFKEIEFSGQFRPVEKHGPEDEKNRGIPSKYEWWVLIAE